MDFDAEQPSTPARRRVDLNCLPANVKTHIARLCAKQDRALKDGLSFLHQTERGTLADLIASFERDKRGASIRGLYCASKEWSSIAAPFRFNSLDVKGLRSPVFQMRLAHTHGQHFREVKLLGAKLCDFIILAPLLPFLPNVTKIWVSDFRPAALRLLDPIELDERELTHLETTITAILTRAEHIVAHVNATDVLPTLVPEAARSRLLRLSVILSDAAACSAFFDLLPSLALPPLRVLEVASPDVAPSLLDFMSLFAPTLEQIFFKAASYSLSFRPQIPTGSTSFVGPFPKLATLSLFGDAAALEGPLGGICDDNMPLLKTLVYFPDRLPAQPERRAGEPFIPAPHRIIPLQVLGVYTAEYPKDRTLLEKLPISSVPMAQQKLDRNFYEDVLWYSQSPAESPGDFDFADVEETDKDAIDYLRTWTERAKVQRDTASLVRIARALCQVELERIAYEA
ncbi:hypothetical protein BMF94_3349 [Rhodotorula taiwanensis]|uniref:Uncharacterized protein n=1 Tax=Rhodotorula taiwanensis TaxID=741276 RepID=A0A2S5BAM1_9BASI|nr:hypothetical protein BMF94_3349 [Rhodotorula taiwanensis]